MIRDDRLKLWILTPRELMGAVGCLLGIPCLLAVLMTPLDTPRGATRSEQCKNNIKQILIAFHNYHDAYQTLPPLAAGEPPVSWRVEILDLLEQAPLQRTYDRTRAWDDPANLKVVQTEVWAFQCPSDPVQADPQGRRYASYMLPVWSQGAYKPLASQPPTFRAITDDKSHTILVVEACGQRIVWTDPHDANLSDSAVTRSQLSETALNSDTVLSSFHDGFAHAGMADGSVRKIDSGIDSSVLTQLLNSGDGLPQDF